MIAPPMVTTPNATTPQNIIKSRRICFRSRSVSMSAESRDPHAVLERLEFWSAIATCLILVAIIIEIGSVLYFHTTGAESYVNIFANALIALGLAAEFFLILATIKWTREANIVSDQQVAVANEVAGAANERAAKLEMEAATLRERAATMEARVAEMTLEIVQIKAPRELDAHQSAEITKRCEPFKGTKFDLADTDGDAETYPLMIMIANILLAAEWDLQHWSGNTMRYKLPNDIYYGVITMENVAVTIHQSEADRLGEAAATLNEGLNANSIKARLYIEDWQDLAQGGTDLAKDTVHILVGKKTLTAG